MIDPPRLIDDPTTDAAMRESLRAAARHVPPFDAAAGLARLEAEIGGAAPAASGGMTGAIVAATVTVAVLGGIAWWGTRAPSAAPQSATAPSEAPAESPPNEPLEEALPSDEPAAELLVEAEPEAVEAVAPVREPSTERRRSDDSLAREMSQLAEARRTLPADPARALALLDRGRREFSSSLFSEERDALRVLALDALGRQDEARAQGERFLAAHPTSAFAERVRRAAVDPTPTR